MIGEEAVKFLRLLKEGDFFGVDVGDSYYDGNVLKKRIRTMLVCFHGDFSENRYEKGWHLARSKFMINLGGNFRKGIDFGIDTRYNEVRKLTTGEMFRLIDEIRKAGYIYNRKTKELTKINP